MKNILIITAVFPPEPIVSAKISSDIVHGLSNNKENVTVIHPRPTRPMGFVFTEYPQVEKELKCVVADSYTSPQSKLLGRMYESYSFGKFCARYIERYRDEIGVIYINSWPVFSQFFIIRASKKCNIPSVLHIQDIYPESYSNKLPTFWGQCLRSLLLPIDKYILRNASRLLLISSSMKGYLTKTRGIADSKCKVIENWQDESEFLSYEDEKSSQKKVNENILTFMYLGNIGPVANLEYVISCFAKAGIREGRLVIAGSGTKKQDCILMSKLHEDVKIEFWEVPSGKVSEVQFQADYLLLPLKKGAAMSSIPSKLPAYMFSKKPIIGCLDVDSDTAKAIIDADCGIVVEPDKEKALIDAFHLATQWTLLEQMERGNRGFAYAMKRFSKKHNLPLILSCIKEYVKS